MGIALPIDEHLQAIIAQLEAQQNLVIVAEPGAGKTTRVAPALLNSGIVKQGRILVLQPRRVAARSTARRIAYEMGLQLGDEIGYRVRFDNCTSEKTRIELLTEGLYLRQLQDNPLLEDVDVVIFDEFHERSLNIDLALALTREVQTELRPDLHIIVMSATLDPGPISQWLDAPTIKVPGRTYPVSIDYDTVQSDQKVTSRCAAAIRSALKEQSDGHILAFLPGVAEIEEVRAALGTIDGIAILPLHGRLKSSEQDAVFAVSAMTKVILATNIAETSVTVDGVTTVIDTGLARVPCFDAVIGLERLELQRISRASADQRSGRAGRTGPGRCRRLWTENSHRHLSPFLDAEIRRADLTGCALSAWVWGSGPTELGWFERPPAAAVDSANAVLRLIGALDDRGLTPTGRVLAQFPLHPRIARVLVSASESGELKLAQR